LKTGDLVATENGALVFDSLEGHYQAVTGRIYGDVRYANTKPSASPTATFPSLSATFPSLKAALASPPSNTTFITLLTLDVVLDRPNNPVFVDLDFFGGKPSAIGNANVLSTFTEFVCWAEQRIDVAIDPNLTTNVMGRKGTFESGTAGKVGWQGISDRTGAVSLLGLVETIEGPTPGSAVRASISSVLNASKALVVSHFLPE
jgi:hypothetical protein